MQITLKLKGFLKIAVFFIVIVSSIAYAGYKIYRYFTYKEIIHKTAIKRAKNFQQLPFSYTMTVKDTVDKGYLLLAPYVRFNLKYGKMDILDLAGKKYLEREMNGAVIDFRKWNIGGKVRYSYGIDDTEAYHVTLSAGHIVILDSALNAIKKIHLLPYKDLTINKKEDLDLHDFILLSDDHYIAMAMYKKHVDNIPAFLVPSPANSVATPIIQEVKNGIVVWQWNGSDYPEFYLNSEAGNNFYDTATQDYMHINSMTLDPKDSNLIVSFRHLNQIVKIDRHTGAVMWRLGGKNSDFTLSRDQVFLRQHNAVLADNGQTLMIFDNGEKQQRPFSRILEFQLDERNKKIRSFKAFNIPAPFTETLGSVQKIGDDYLISGGSANYAMLINSKTGKKKMELKANQSLYRAYLITDLRGIELTNETTNR